MTKPCDRQPIPWADWSRRDVFEFFSGMSDPFYSVTFTVDVTNLCRFTKETGLSFYYALVYLCTQAVNRVEAFQYVLNDGALFRLNGRSPSFTDLKKGAEQFHIVTMPCAGGIADFCRAARETSAAQTAFIRAEAESDALIYFSCLPWVELTALTNERDFDKDDAIPRIAWGRYTETGGRKKLNMSVEVNHRFIDGLHIGRFSETLAGLIEAL